MNFSKVKTIDYYGEVDGLDGKELLAGEEVEILFPDGTIIKTMIITERGTMESQVDMFSGPDIHRYSKSYIIEIIHGSKLKIYLRDSDLQLRRLESKESKEVNWNVSQ